MAVIKYLDENGDIQTLGVVTTDLAAYAKVTYVTNLLENYVTWDDVATESKAGLMSAEDKTTLDNLSGGGGTTDLETLTIGAVTYDGTEAVSAQNATTTTAGLMSAADKATLDELSESGTYTLPQATADALGGVMISNTRSSTYTYTTGTTTSSRYYGVELDSNGTAFVNIPWLDTQVSQTGISASGNYPMLLKYNANTTNQTTYVNFSSAITANPSTGTITANYFTGTLNGFAEQMEDAYGVIQTGEFDLEDWQVLTYAADAGAWRVTTIEGDNVTFTQDESTNERTITIGDDAWLKKPLWSDTFSSGGATEIGYDTDPDGNAIKYKKIRICLEHDTVDQTISSNDGFWINDDFKFPLIDPIYPTYSDFPISYKVFFELQAKKVWDDGESDYVYRPSFEAWGEAYFGGGSNMSYKFPLYRDTQYLLPTAGESQIPCTDGYFEQFSIAFYSGTAFSTSSTTITVWGEEVSEE